jgi:hypothetical protein
LVYRVKKNLATLVMGRKVLDNIHLVWHSEPGSQNKLCSGTCKARPELARFAQDEKNVSVTERPSLGQAGIHF